MCAQAARAASPPGRRQGFDESMCAASRLNEGLTDVGAVGAVCVGAVCVGTACTVSRELIYLERYIGEEKSHHVWQEEVARAQMKLDWIDGSAKMC